MKQNHRQISLFLVVWLAAVLGAACSGHSAAETSGKTNTDLKQQNQLVETVVVRAESREVPKFIETTGTFQADETAEVAAEIGGLITATPVAEGAFVRQGDVLIRLNEREAQLKLEQSRAAERQAAQQIVQAEAQTRQAAAAIGLDKSGGFNENNLPEVRQAATAIRTAEADVKLAATNEKRFANLLETGDASRLVYDQRRNELDKALATLAEAKERLRGSQNAARQNNQAVKAAEANTETARAALDSARRATALAEKTVTDATVRAPFAGYIASRSAAVGEVIQPGTTVATLVRTNPVKLRLQISAANAGQITLGMSVSAATASFPERRFAGTVTAINPSLDAQARVLTVEAAFENSDNALRPGMFAAARILQTAGEPGIYIPRTTLIKDKNTDSFSVFVIDGDTARLRVVQIDENAPEEPGLIRALSGIGENELLATTNLEQLFDGTKVMMK